MKLVRESINFERGGNPLKKMRVGLQGWENLKIYESSIYK